MEFKPKSSLIEKKLHYICRVKILNFISALFVFCVLVFSSCKNDLKLNAPYKEIPSIYAVLNPFEKIQVIRINKVFLGEGDANQMAQVADSINYPAGELSVTLSHSGGGTISFRDSMLQTAAGAFNTNQRVYVSSEPIKTSGTYTLTVKNNRTGNIFTARANALDSVKPTSIQPLSTAFSYDYVMAHPEDKDNNYYVNYSGTSPASNGENNKRYGINSARSGQIYQFAIRVHYYDLLVDNSKVYDYVDYNFVNQYATDASVIPPYGLSLPITFTSKEFFTSMGTVLKNKYPDGEGSYYNFSGRRLYKIQYFIYSSSQEYLDYLQYVSPSLNIAQSKPLYSNFDNKAAMGIFTFRTRFSVVKAVHTFFINEFANNSNTKPYHFLPSPPTPGAERHY